MLGFILLDHSDPFVVQQVSFRVKAVVRPTADFLVKHLLHADKISHSAPEYGLPRQEVKQFNPVVE
jgi:hypothetical protein